MDSEVSQTEINVVTNYVCRRYSQFDGPASSHVGGVKYTTLCSHGKKQEGEKPKAFEFHAAIDEYEKQLIDFIASAKSSDPQVAWRRRPEICGIAGGYYVSSRLAVI